MIDAPLVELQAIKVPSPHHRFTIKEWGTIDNTQFLDKLQLKVGARVTCVYNINTLDYLVNGAMGTVVGFERNKANKIEVVMVAFDNPKCGLLQREQYPFLAEKYKSMNGTPIMIQEMEYHASSSSGKAHAARPKIFQFPLRLGWANTSHK